MVASFVGGVYIAWTCTSIGLRALGSSLAAHFDFWSYLVSNLGHEVRAVLPTAWQTLALAAVGDPSRVGSTGRGGCWAATS
jgi:hypothetical protein